jgi:Flp pilus assembly protein TadG
MIRSCDINKRLHGQRGSVIIWFALLLPVLLGFTGFAIDVARFYLTRVELQNAAEAAALAGARKFAETTDSSEAKIEANTVAKKNYANGGLIPDTYVTPTVAYGTGYPYAIKVTIALSGMNLIFGPFVGMNSSDVQASAIAAAQSVVPPATASIPILVQ